MSLNDKPTPGRPLGSLFAALGAAKNKLTGKIEINGGFTNGYDTALWVAPTQRTNPTTNSQGVYVQHRVSGDLGGLVHDAAASELRLNGATNTGTGQSAHEASLVVTGGANTIGTMSGVLGNFHTEGTPTGTASNVALFRATQIPPLAAGFTIGTAVGLYVENQIVGSTNYSVYAPDGDSVLGVVVPKDTGTAALRVQALTGQTAALIQALGPRPSSTTLFRVDANGTGGFGSTISGSTFYANNNAASGTTVVAAFKGNASQTAPLTQWLNSGGSLLSYVASNGDVRAVNTKFAVRNAGDTATMFSVSAAGPKWDDVSLQQTTVGAAGGAAALPSAPTKYLKVQDSSGVTLVIPAYAAS